MSKTYILLGLLSLVLFLNGGACDSDSGGNSSDADSDTDTDADTDADADSDADTDADTDADSDADTDADSDSDTDTESFIENEWGFDLTAPSTQTLSCEDWEGNVYDWQTNDSDWICTFTYEGVEGVVYIQNEPVACEVVMGEQAIYSSATAQISINGSIEALADAAYDWGGNHRNDSLSFVYNDLTFEFYHSSFGYGWRSCQNMDCMRVTDADGTVVEDGCACERSLPAACVQVQTDGTYAELVDTFEVCLGDETCQ